MVYINHDCENRATKKGKIGGAMCICNECQEKRHLLIQYDYSDAEIRIAHQVAKDLDENMENPPKEFSDTIDKNFWDLV